MACFLVTVAEAAVVGVVQKKVKCSEKKSLENGENGKMEYKIPFSRKLKWLTSLLAGGAVLLMFEHIWHGEVTLWFPFLTAMANTSDRMQAFHEMATVGVSMTAFVTFVWGMMCVVADSIVKRSVQKEQNN